MLRIANALVEPFPFLLVQFFVILVPARVSKAGGCPRRGMVGKFNEHVGVLQGHPGEGEFKA